MVARVGRSRLFAQSCENARPAACFGSQRNGPAPVAQPDRVVASEAIGRGVESLPAHHCSVAGRLAGITRPQAARPRTTGWIVRNYDLDFLKKFSLVIGFLAVVTVGLIFFASHLQNLI